MSNSTVLLLFGVFLLLVLAVRLWADHGRRAAPAPPRPPATDRDRRTAPLAPGTTLRGRVWVGDGDSITLKGHEIRLFGIDAPEMKHPFGKAAKRKLISLCRGQQIVARVIETDPHGRNVARCHLPDGRDLSAEMVRAGLALDWPKHSQGCYLALETPDARQRLWLADARQQGKMYLWKRYDEERARDRNAARDAGRAQEAPTPRG